jgi:hypothetical protein
MTKDTRKMGEIAVEHHKKLQSKPEMTDERKKAIQNLEKIINGKTIDNSVCRFSPGTSRRPGLDRTRTAKDRTSGPVFRFSESKIGKRPVYVNRSVFEGPVRQTGKKPEPNRTEPRSGFFSGCGCLTFLRWSVAVAWIEQKKKPIKTVVLRIFKLV